MRQGMCSTRVAAAGMTRAAASWEPPVTRAIPAARKRGGVSAAAYTTTRAPNSPWLAPPSTRDRSATGYEGASAVPRLNRPVIARPREVTARRSQRAKSRTRGGEVRMTVNPPTATSPPVPDPPWENSALIAGRIPAGRVSRLTVTITAALSRARWPQRKEFTRACPTYPRRPQVAPAGGSTVVDELERRIDLLGALEERDDGLQVVAGLRTHPDFVTGDLGLHALGALVADELCDLLRILAIEALLEGPHEPEFLPGRRGLAVAEVESLERDPAAEQLRLEDVEEREHPLGRVGGHDDRLVNPLDRGAYPAEVVPVRDLFGRLVEGVVHLLAVHFGDDVEGRNSSHVVHLSG